MKRIHLAYTAEAERAMLQWIAVRLPPAVTPDGLTLFGLFGSVVCFAGLVASRFSPNFLLLALIGLLFQNFGDSLDGNVARLRRIERPRYGFIVDHGSDMLSQVLLALGFGLSPYVRLDCALLACVGYLCVTVVSFQLLHLTGELHLSYNRIGPTEVRIVLFVGILLLYFFGRMPLGLFHGALAVSDMVALALFFVSSFLAYSTVWRTARSLSGERPGATASGS
jgi:archaetidylinositol phosphate synthase